MANRDSPFSHLRKGLGEDLRQKGVDAAEAGAVKCFSRVLGLDVKPIYDDAENRRGVRQLSFESFRYCYPDFPYMVEFIQLPVAKKELTIGKSFCNFQSSSIIRTYLRTFDVQEIQDTHCALVFPWQGVTSGLVAHNGDLDYWTNRTDKGSLRWVFASSNLTLIIERTLTFLEGIRAVWP